MNKLLILAIVMFSLLGCQQVKAELPTYEGLGIVFCNDMETHVNIVSSDLESYSMTGNRPKRETPQEKETFSTTGPSQNVLALGSVGRSNCVEEFSYLM